MRVIFSDQAYLAVLAETSEKIATETGGIFLGCFQDDIFYIVEAIDPGPKSTFQVAYFEYDQKYTQHLINKIARLYEYKLTLVGLWHRHPGSFDEFSSTDNGTNLQYAQLSEYGAVSVLVNIDPKFRITTYHVSNPLKYQRIAYEIGDELIPEHIMKRKNTDDLLNQINGYRKRSAPVNESMQQNDRFERLLNIMKPRFHEVSYSEFEQGTEADSTGLRGHMVDSLLDDFTFLMEAKGILLAIEQDDRHITVSQQNGTAKLYFTCNPSTKQILFSYGGKCYHYNPRMFLKLLGEPISPIARTPDTSFRGAIKRLLENIRW